MILLFADFKLVFWLLSFVGIVSLILTLLLEETLAEEKRYSGPLIRTMGQVFVVLKNKSFLWLVIIFSLGSLPFMGYIAISSYVYEIYFGLSEQMFSIYFAANACAFILGPFLYYRFFRGYDNDFLIRGNFILCIIFGIAVMVFGSYAPWAFGLLYAYFVDRFRYSAAGNKLDVGTTAR